MIFRARMPPKPMPTSLVDRCKSQSRKYDKLPDELFDEILLGAMATNGGLVGNPLFPKRNNYVFIIANNKPADTETFKWEEIDGDIVTGIGVRLKPNTRGGYKRPKMEAIRKEIINRRIRNAKKKLS